MKKRKDFKMLAIASTLKHGETYLETWVLSPASYDSVMSLLKKGEKPEKIRGVLNRAINTPPEYKMIMIDHLVPIEYNYV